MSEKKYHCRKCGAEVLAGPYVAPELCHACQLVAHAEQSASSDITSEMVYRVAELHGTIKQQAAEIERNRATLETQATLISDMRGEIERLKAENVAIKATALEIFSPNCEHHTGENTLPWDEFVARTSKVCMLCALDVITRQADEIEQLRAYSAAYNTLLAERVEIECLRGLAIRAWHSFRSGLTAGGGCDCGLTDADILELVRLANEHPPA